MLAKSLCECAPTLAQRVRLFEDVVSQMVCVIQVVAGSRLALCQPSYRAGRDDHPFPHAELSLLLPLPAGPLEPMPWCKLLKIQQHSYLYKKDTFETLNPYP